MTGTWLRNSAGTVLNSHSYSNNAANQRTRQTRIGSYVNYAYDTAGNLTSINYPVSSDIALSYDALSRLTNVVDALGTTRYGYTSAGLLQSEDDPWADDTVTYAYNNARLRSSLTLAGPNAPAWSQGYGYDAARRLQTVTSPAGSFGYTYKGAGNH